MKLEIKTSERGSKNYYDEVLYVAKKYLEFLKNPNKKVYKATNFIIYSNIASLGVFITFLILYLFNPIVIYLVYCIIALLLILLLSVSYLKYKKAINEFINTEGISIFEMDKDGIRTKRIIKESETTHDVKWENVKNIIITKYSIIFINDDKLTPLISSDIKNKDKIIECLEKLKKADLIITK